MGNPKGTNSNPLQPRRPGGRGGDASGRVNKATFRAAKGNVPAKKSKPAVSGKGKSGCDWLVLVVLALPGAAVALAFAVHWI